ASRSTVVTSQMTDGKNVFTWLEDSSWDFGSYVLGVTMPVYDSYGTINEADIAFNGYNIAGPWSTTSSSMAYTDIESVAVHELGHYFGAQHVIGGESMSEPPTMAPSILPDLQSRTLSLDDQKGVCFLYPESTYACSDTDDCPNIINPYDQYEGQLACENNSCAGVSEATGSGTLGDSCFSSGDCAASYFCQPTSDGSRYCTQDCNPNVAGSCPSGFECYGYANAAGGACLPDGNTSSSSGSSGGGSGSASGETAYGCTCDLTTICDGNCHCDPECQCDCDLTTICDDNCGCDPECNGGCASFGPSSTEPQWPGPWLYTLAILGVLFLLQRKKLKSS
ncbi:MAG: matrixin family metalloprotease, partial [Myxococcota bacterium]|nr:matrixin family metalloprotease [Myxococcota bacterium]